jgi:hypothetical protein
VESQAEDFLHVQCGGKNLTQCPEGAEFLDLFAEGAVLGLKLTAAIQQALDLLEGTDLAGLALDEGLQFLKPPLERRVVDLNAFT